jgi:hypothetical protein
MVKFRHTIWILYLLNTLCLPGIVIAEGVQDMKNMHIVFDLISGDLLLQVYGRDASGNNINHYRSIPDFRTTSIRSINKNGQQYTELMLTAENPDEPLLLAHVFTHMLARECTLLYDRDNDTLNLIINNAGGIQVNSYNGQDLLSPVSSEEPMLMFVWPGNTELFEVDVSINE